MTKDIKVKSVETKKKKGNKTGNEDQVVENNINIKIDLSKEDANKSDRKSTRLNSSHSSVSRMPSSA